MKNKVDHRLIPLSRHEEIEGLIGEIRSWSWRDPRIARHLPDWEAGIYEATLKLVLDNAYSTKEVK